MQSPLPFMLPNSEWSPTPVHQLPSWGGARRISIDTEFRDPTLRELGPGVRRGAKIVGVSFKIEDGGAFYLPMRHPEGNLPVQHVLDYLRDNAESFKGVLVGANMQVDLDFLAEEGIHFSNVSGYRDIQVSDPLLNELHNSYSVEAICAREGIPGKDYELLREATVGYNAGLRKKDVMSKEEMIPLLPAKFVGPYAIQDVKIPLVINRRQERRIEEAGLQQIHDLECKLIPILVRMRRRGVLIDQNKLSKVEDWSVVQVREALDKVHAEIGYRLSPDDVNKAAALAKVLKIIGVDVPLTRTGLPSVDKELLGRIDHPVAKLILRARRFDKLRSTFCGSIRRHMTKGRIHTTFNQMRKTDDEGDDSGARYGRLSSTDPNLQQQPARDPEIGKMWRSIYIPEPGMLWATNDYSQQEPRMTVHFAEICGCEKAREAADRYRNDPKTDNHTMMAQLIAGAGADWKPSKKERDEAKLIFLGLAYGMGGAKLAHSLGLPTEWRFIERLGKQVEVAGPEAQALFDRFHAGVPFVRELSQQCMHAVKTKGYIRTILGRHLHFPEIPPDERRKPDEKYDWLHKALNRLIQGSSADQTKLAVLKIEEAGHQLQLQVHDEVDLSVRDRAHAEEVAEIMRTCLPLRVPCRVDVEIGPSWGEIKGD